MTPASEIIERLGGNKAVADLLGLERTAVQRWTYQPPKGLGNKVPMRHWAALAEMSNGKVSLAELMDADFARAVARPKRTKAA